MLEPSLYWVRGLGREIFDLELNRQFPLFYRVPVVYSNAKVIVNYL